MRTTSEFEFSPSIRKKKTKHSSLFVYNTEARDDNDLMSKSSFFHAKTINNFESLIVEALKIPSITANKNRADRNDSQENRIKYRATVDLNPTKSTIIKKYI